MIIRFEHHKYGDINQLELITNEEITIIRVSNTVCLEPNIPSKNVIVEFGLERQEIRALINNLVWALDERK